MHSSQENGQHSALVEDSNKQAVFQKISELTFTYNIKLKHLKKGSVYLFFCGLQSTNKRSVSRWWCGFQLVPKRLATCLSNNFQQSRMRLELIIAGTNNTGLSALRRESANPTH